MTIQAACPLCKKPCNPYLIAIIEKGGMTTTTKRFDCDCGNSWAEKTQTDDEHTCPICGLKHTRHTGLLDFALGE